MKIEKYLLEKGLKPHLKGFGYLVQAIEMCKKDSNVLNKITTELYPVIAKSSNDTTDRVIGAIRHVLVNGGQKIKNAEFIATALIELEN